MTASHLRSDVTDGPRPAASAVAILGTVEVSSSTRTTSLAGTNLPALLSLLALTPGRPVSNDRLLDALWPNSDPVRARRSLISLVHQLNQTLGMHLGGKPVVSVKSVGRALRIDPSTIDVVQFERRLAEGDDHVAAGRLDQAVGAYEAALGLWRGEPFGGLDLPCFVETSAQLRMARHRGEAALIAVSLRIGRGAAIVPWLLQRVDADPFDEQVAADAAHALYQAGRSSDALRILRACMDELRRRGLEPRPATRQLELDVLGHTLDSVDEVTTARSTARSGSNPVQLIGRRSERSTLDLWLNGSAGSSVMVIAGEAGIGKTALLDAWVDDLADQQSVVRTRCSPEQILPFEAFSGLLGEQADTANEGLTATERPFPTSRHVQFDEVVHRLVAPTAPVAVLAIDDAQWMTVASVALLRHVLWHPQVKQLHVVLTMRSPDAVANPALNQLLVDLSRIGRSADLHLAPFEPAEIDELIAREGTATIDTDGLLRMTGGNPLFAIQMLRSGQALETGITAVPSTIESLLSRYLEPLSAASRRIIEVAALLGAQGEPSRLAACAGASELDVMDALDEVGGGRLLHVEPIGGGYRFVHDLARRTVIAGIGAARAARMHVLIAEVLEREQRPDRMAVAHHLSVGREAASPQRVVQAVLHAASTARNMFDYETSERLAGVALEMTENAIDRADVLVLLVNSAQMRGDQETEGRYMAEAATLATADDTPAVLVRTVHILADHHSRDTDADLVAIVQRAYERVRAAGTGVELIEAAWALCRQRRYTDPAALIPVASEALDIARSLPTRLPLLQALHARAIVGQAAVEDPTMVVAWCEEGVALSRRDGNPMMAAVHQATLVHSLMQCGRFADARAVQADLMRAADASNSPEMKWNIDVRSANFLLMQDRLNEAAPAVDRAAAQGAVVGGTRHLEEHMAQMSVLHTARDRLGDLAPSLRSHAADFDVALWHWVAALGLAQSGDIRGAQLERAGIRWSADPAAVPHWMWLPELTVAAQVAFCCDDQDLGRRVAERIEPRLDQHAVFGGMTLSLGSMLRPYAYALAAAGKPDQALDAMRRARRANGDAGLALWARLCGDDRLAR
jgi:DNA-binding SARP family transcriptional activator